MASFLRNTDHLTTFSLVVDPSLGSSVPQDLPSLANLQQEPAVNSSRAALANALTDFQDHIRRNVDGNASWSFFADLMPLLCSWASAEPWASTPVPLLLQGQAASVSLPQPLVRCLMANAFLLNIQWPTRAAVYRPVAESPENQAPLDGDGYPVIEEEMQGVPLEVQYLPETFGKHSWRQVFLSSSRVAKEKVLCLLAYFFTESRKAGRTGELAEEQDVVVERLQASESSGGHGVPTNTTWQHWKASDAAIRSSMVRLHVGTMEESPGRTFVDFANRFVGYTRIIPSATQEEILWCTVPAVQPASLLCEEMLPNEAVIIRNVRRVSQYQGFLHSFRWTGFRGWDRSRGAIGDAPEMDVLVMDAFVAHGNSARQFSPEALFRDVFKAYLGFSGVGGTTPGESTLVSASDSVAGPVVTSLDPQVISSGNWGCGEFAGNKGLKFLQQVCAVAYLNSRRHRPQTLRLDFSTYGDERQLRSCRLLLEAMEGRDGVAGATVGKLCSALEDFGCRRDVRGLDEDELFSFLQDYLC